MIFVRTSGREPPAMYGRPQGQVREQLRRSSNRIPAVRVEVLSIRAGIERVHGHSKDWLELFAL